MKVAVIGTGYVGLVTGAVLAHLGHELICVDKDKEKLAEIAKGHSPIFEPGLQDLLRLALDDGLLKVSDSIAEATKSSEIIFISVGTPPLDDGSPDLTMVKAVARDIARAIDHHVIVVNKSTVPVGTGYLVEEIIRSEGAPDELFDVVSNPEFLREGSAVKDALDPERVVIGSRRRDAALKLFDLYAPLERPALFTDLSSAELIKYASNSFLAMKISFINAMSRLCETCGANISDVSRGMGADTRIGPAFLNAGLGWGGSCFPKDVLGLITTSEKLGYDFKLLKTVWEINEEQTHRFLDRLEERLGGFEGKRIGLLGLAFKPETDDIREAKSLVIIERILKGGGSVVARDAAAGPGVLKLFPSVQLEDDAYGVAVGADALVLVTEWKEFKNLDFVKLGSAMNQKVLFDGRRIYDPAKLRRAGFEFHAIGLASEHRTS